MKRCISIIIVLCLLVGSTLPIITFADADVHQTEYLEIDGINPSDYENVYVSEDIFEHEEADNDVPETKYLYEEDNESGDAEDSDPEPEDVEEDDSISDNKEEENNPESENAEAEEEDGDPDEENKEIEIEEEEEEEEEEEGEEEEGEEEEKEEDEKEEGRENPENNNVLILHIEIDYERNVSILTSPQIDYEVVDENGEGDIMVILKPEDIEIGMDENDIIINLSDGWAYKVDIDIESMVIVITLIAEEVDTERLEIHIEVDDERNVTVFISPRISYEVVDEYGKGDITVILNPEDIEIDFDENGIVINLSEGWTYKTDIDIERKIIMLTLSAEEDFGVERLEIHIELDDERGIEVTMSLEIEYEIIDEDGDNDIIVIFKPEDAEIETDEEDISLSLPEGWNYEIEIGTDTDTDGDTITVTLFEERIIFTRSSFSPFFTPEEIGNPNMWYAVPDFETTLASGANVYTRLRTAIQGATPNAVTHIIIPFHINTGGIGVNGSVVRVPNGATVVLIGNHPTAANGQIVLSDTHDTSNVSRPFRVRGNNSERTALVLRNVAIQNSTANSAQATPEEPPAPIPLTSQTGSARGGGVSIEPTDGGGGHLILCRGGELRHNTTDNNGPVDIQASGRFTMMPGSLIQDNAAGNSGGGVNVNGANSRFNMYGGTIRNNLARGENLNSPSMRAVGGGVLVQNGGTFNMYGGEIYGNYARLDEIAADPLDANAIVTSSGGGVFVTGAASSFNMYGGTINNNNAIRTRSSNVTLPANINNFRAGNGGGVYVTGGAAFNMHYGYIHNNTAEASGTAIGNNAVNLSNGGGVFVSNSSVFTMEGGVISNNHAIGTVAAATSVSGNGGGVYINGTFIMTGGEISGNNATVGNNAHQRGGGGVFLDGNSTFVMNKGEISRNTINNLANWQGGGGVFVAGSSRFVMHNGEIYRNTSTLEGGGVFVGVNAGFTMNGGSITHNTALSTGRGGGGVWVMGGFFTTANPAGNITAKTISHNRTKGHGGGIGAQGREAGGFTGTGAVTIAEGTVIEGNEAGIDGGIQLLGGLGGGLLLNDQASLNMSGGEILDNYAARDGGGIALWNTSAATISAGEIRGNRTDGDGGGFILNTNNNRLTMTGGTIKDNLANNGGAIFVPHANLSLVTIDPKVELSENVARNGLRIDTALAIGQRPRIDPGKVSITGWNVIDEMPANSGNFGIIVPHAFTNYDINSEGSRFWRVTYEVGEAEGEVLVDVGLNNFPVQSNSFVPDGAELNFNANPADLFKDWEIWTSEIGGSDDFELQDKSIINSLQHTVTQHTHIIGNFNPIPTTTTLSISKEITGEFSNRNKDFEFTIFFTDLDGSPLPAGTQFSYIGGIIADSGAAAPPSGILVLDSNGSASFRLGHGQLITIEEAPLSAYVQIVETPDVNYAVSFTDSENEGVSVNSNDTTPLPMTEERSFSFNNERIMIVPTGVNPGSAGAVIPLFVLLSSLAIVMFAADSAYRRKKKFCKP